MTNIFKIWLYQKLGLAIMLFIWFVIEYTLYAQTYFPTENMSEIVGYSLLFTIIGEGMEAFISMPTIWLNGLTIEYLRKRKRSNIYFIAYSTLIIAAITLAWDTIVFLLILILSRKSSFGIPMSFLQIITVLTLIATTISITIYTHNINHIKSA